MKTILLALMISGLGTPARAASEKIDYARFQLRLIRAMDKMESDRASNAWMRWVLPDSEAVSTYSCITAGWEGTKDGANGICTRKESKDAAQIQAQCGGSGTVLCNPDVFGKGVCITPESGNYHWTLQCESQFLQKAGISKPVDQLSDADLGKVNESLKAQDWNYLNAADPLSVVCARVKQHRDRYAGDCEQVHQELLGISKKIAALPAAPPPVVTDNSSKDAKTQTAAPKPPPYTGKSKDQCGYVNLADKLGPVKNQGMIGDCYAFSAVELMNFGAPPEQQVSAIATAIEYGEWYETVYKKRTQKKPTSSSIEREVDGFGGGQIASAIVSARDEGVCLESEVASYGYDDAFAIEQMRVNFRALLDKRCSPVRNTALKAVDGFAENVFMNLSKHYHNQRKTDRKFNERNEKIVQEILDDPTIPDADKFQSYLRKLVDVDCKKRQIGLPLWAKGTPKTVSCKVNDEARRPQFLGDAFNYIQSSLDQGVPAGVGYDTTGLLQKTGGGHASVVAGRKYVEDSDPTKAGCYLLVKNSWGAEWPGKNKLDGMDALPATDDQGKPIPGYYQVKDEVFAKYIHSFTNLGVSDKAPVLSNNP